MMDQNNYGLFGIFFFYGPIFLVHNFSKDGISNYFRLFLIEKRREAKRGRGGVGGGGMGDGGNTKRYS